MASFISVNKGSILDKALTNYKSAKDAAISTAVNDLKGDWERVKSGRAITTAKDDIPIAEALNADTSAPTSYYGGGGGSGGSAGGGMSYGDVMQLINDTAAANNEWSAQQAQKQMDFQREMSSSAHQREVEDLQKAGLNPVLSAGGSGASTPTGAMGDTDTSNTRLIGEIAAEAVQALGMTASGYATAKKAEASGSFLGKLTDLYSDNKLFKKVVDTGLGIGQKVVSYKINKSIATSALKALAR